MPGELRQRETERVPEREREREREGAEDTADRGSCRMPRLLAACES